MRIRKACKFAQKFFTNENDAKHYGMDKEKDRAYLKIGRSWYECLYIGVVIGFSDGGDAVWHAVERVPAKKVYDFCPAKDISGTGESVRDLVIFE